MLALPIMAPSKPYSSRISTARSGEFTSPFPNTGMCTLGLFFTAAICVQSASPLYICALVLPCIEIAFAPTSCKRSATSTICMLSQSQPKRVLTVMGKCVRFTISAVSDTINGMSFKIPAPAPLETTFLTGQPKLISIMSGLVFSTMSTDCNMESRFAPKIWIPTGRSAS